MSDFDLTIRHGTLVTAADTVRADIGIRDGRIVTITESLVAGRCDLDATDRLLARDHGAPKFHAVAHDPLAEGEATHRAIQLSRILDVPILIVHVSGIEAVNAIRTAQTRGARILAETCPQYLFLTAADIDKPGLEGAKWCCSPPPRDPESQEAVWNGLANGTFQVFSSDHAPYRFDQSGKLPDGDKTTFKNIANGMPGLEVRLPLLFSEGVGTGRIGLNQFVALAATNAARIYGLYPRKGTLAVGADADVAIWNPAAEVTIRAANMHDNAGYSPYEGRVVKGWPETVVSRGRVVVANGALCVEKGTGKYLVRGTPEPVATARPGSARASALKGLVN